MRFMGTLRRQASPASLPRAGWPRNFYMTRRKKKRYMFSEFHQYIFCISYLTHAVLALLYVTSVLQELNEEFYATQLTKEI